MNEPELTRDHIIRADLPWRKADRTQCGRPVKDVGSYTTMEVIADRIKRLGRQRTAFTVCMTCFHTGSKYQTWAESPVEVIQREAWGQDTERLANDLRALAALAEAHRGEFDDYLSGLAETIDLASRRRRAR
jgi:hypothetical protein